MDNDRYMLLYSKNLLDWEQGETLHLYGAAECPDLFCLPLDGDPARMKWVLWGSTDCYMIGRFEGRRFIPETPAVAGSSHKLFSAYSDSAWSPGGYAPGGPAGPSAAVPACPMRSAYIQRRRGQGCGYGPRGRWRLCIRAAFLFKTGAWRSLSAFPGRRWAKPWI